MSYDVQHAKVVGGFRGRDFLILEHLIGQNASSAEWVINIFHTFS